MLEKGPRTLRGVSDGTVLIMDTLKDLGKEAVIQSIDKGCIADKKFLLDPSDKLVQVPNSISTTVKFLLNPLGKGLITGMMGEWFRKNLHILAKTKVSNPFVTEGLGITTYQTI